MDVNEHVKLFNITLRNSYCIAIQHLTVAVGFSTMSKIRTRILKSKKDTKKTITKRKGQNDKKTITKRNLKRRLFKDINAATEHTPGNAIK